MGKLAPTSDQQMGGERSGILSPDGLDLFYTVGPNYDIIRSTRATLAVDFATGTPQTALNSPQDDAPSWVSHDKKRLYFNSSRLGLTKNYLADIGGAPSVNPLGAPINGAMYEDTSAMLTADELRIVWASTRAGGSMDIYETDRPTMLAPFGNVTVVTGANSNKPDYPTNLSPDGCVLYVVRQDGVSGGYYNIYVSTRPK